MDRRNLGTALCVCAGAALLLGPAVRGLHRPPAGPRSVPEAAAIAEAVGLYARSDRPDGVVHNRVVVADRPVSCATANFVRFGDPTHPSWNGAVAVCYPAQMYLPYADGEYGVVWGEVVLFGDPTLVRWLTGGR